MSMISERIYGCLFAMDTMMISLDSLSHTESKNMPIMSVCYV